MKQLMVFDPSFQGDEVECHQMVEIPSLQLSSTSLANLPIPLDPNVMSFQWTRGPSLNLTKNLSIPDHVPVGAVIGRGGRNCRKLRDSHGVRCSVNGDDRKVTLNGPRTGVKGAEDELESLFASFAITKPAEERVFELVARDGPTRWWSFERDNEPSKNAMVEEYRYRLQQSGRATETGSQRRSWIKEFREDDVASVMNYLLENPTESPPSMKISFGKLCFMLKSTRCEKPTAWPELQKLRNFHDFMRRWSNFCNRKSPSIAALMDDLEGLLEEGIEPQKALSVHLAGHEGSSYDLKYHLVDGQWELHNAYSRRTVRGTYDVILDNDTSFRVRAVARDDVAENAVADIQRYLDVSIPANGDFFETEVALNDTAPTGMSIRAFDTKAKVHVEVNGLRFSISYLDELKKEFRLECRLTAEEKEKLGADGNAAQVLIEKVLQMLS